MDLLNLAWKKHSTTFFSLLNSLRHKESLTDVYLGCEGELFPAHQIVLSISSDYFATIFETYKTKSPVIIIKDIRKQDLISLLEYMYTGEVNIKESELTSLIKAAEVLKIKGLLVDESQDSTSSTNLSKTFDEEELQSCEASSKFLHNTEKTSPQKMQSTSISTENVLPPNEVKPEPDAVRINERSFFYEDNQDTLKTGPCSTDIMEQHWKFDKEDCGGFTDGMDFINEDNSSQMGQGIPFGSACSANVSSKSGLMHYIRTIPPACISGTGTSNNPGRRDCVRCKKARGKRRRITTECAQCKVALCSKPCFYEYHAEDA